MTRKEYLSRNKVEHKQDIIKERSIFNGYVEQVNKLLTSIPNYLKLSETQKKLIDSLAFDMFKHYLTESYIMNHYEIFQDDVAGVEIYKQYRIMEDNNIYLGRGNSSTWKALEKKGLIKIIEDGGIRIDEITPLFILDFSKIIIEN